MLYTKSIYAPKSDSDGIRISVMSRHTLEDGITPDPKITTSSYDYWLKILAPTDRSVGDYYKRGLPFEEYSKRYKTHLAKKEISPTIESLARQALIQNITFLCVEESAEKCHRKILAEICQTYQPTLKVEHR
jgi:uncharacterized protein YeaO (DUF488 family)